MLNNEFAERREVILQSIERDRQEMRDALHEITGAAESSLDVREHIRTLPLTWAIGAMVVGAWLGSRETAPGTAGQRRDA